MGPLPSPEPLADDEVELLLDIADKALVTALVGDRPALPALDTLPQSLHARTGAFVTLKVGGELNGCIGTLDGDEPLGHAVHRLALSAAFADYRLPPLRPTDYRDLTIELSLLSPLTPIDASTRGQLLDELEPGHDGIVVKTGSRQGLFLPSVWEQLPDAEDFLDHLWRKAGLAPRTWPPGLETFRFRARKHERRAGTGGRTPMANS